MAVNDQRQRPDWFYRGILAVAAAIALWLILMPFCISIQRATLNRFHLQSGSFARWAIQAPIPAMYNFYNRSRIEALPWDATAFDPPLVETVNHFPTRIVTFAQWRAMVHAEENRRMVTLRSDYRGQSLQTRWIGTPREDGGVDLSDEVLP